MTRRGEAAAIGAAAIVFAAIAGLRIDGGWASSDWLFRLQTDAMLRGTFALQPLPYRQHADWAWGVGNQQVWGLGVPLLRLPFEAAARVAGAPGFPDRLVFVLLFAAVLLVLTRALRTAPPGARIGVPLVTLFFPPFLLLCRTRFSVYEEPVAYGYLWAILLLALTIEVASRDDRRTLAALALASGFSPFIRPTLIFYGAVTALVAAAIVWPRRERASALAALAGGFALGPLAQLGTNWLRFRDLFEFGQRVNVSRYPLDQLAKNFDYAFAHEPLTRAAIELAGALFFTGRGNGVDFYGSGLYWWQSPTYRFREFYFATFDGVMLAALVAGWIAIAVYGRRAWLRAIGVWSLASFALQTIFYVRMVSMTSRYAMDFAAAIAAALAGGVWLVADAIDRQPGTEVRRWSVGVLAVGLVLGIASTSARGWIDPTHAARPLVTVDQARRLMPAPATSGPPVPSGYRCGDDLGRLGIPFNGIGWNTTGDCTVQASTTVFLGRPACVAIAANPIERGATVNEIRVKYGVTFLERRGGAVFCPPAGFQPNPTGIEVVYVAWVDPIRAAVTSRPFRVEAIESVNRP